VKKAANVVALSKDGEYFIAGHTDNSATIYNVRGEIKQLHSFQAHNNTIKAADFMLSTSQVVTAGLDNTINFWDLATGQRR
jgi:WD40 repeat protein